MVHRFFEKTRKIFKYMQYDKWMLFVSVIYLVLVFRFVVIDQLDSSLFFSIYGVLVIVYIISRFLFAYFYDTIPDNDYEPTVTFVVPAYNEEGVIKVTLETIYKVDYPREKLEVVAINDGSSDNTYQRMLEVQMAHPDMTVVNWTENRGKRHGMAEGIVRAKNDILVFIDSDSFVDRDSIKTLVKYFHDPEVGAVSGHTEVYNSDVNVLTKMQAVRYFIAFSVLKRAEGVFGSVTCCSGCFAAYRRDYVLPILDKWLNQRFLGSVCTYGDDRSLTNLLLRDYKLNYSPESIAWTIVPENMKQYLKQQLRWKKSWTRESLLATLFIWRKNPIMVLSFYTGIILTLLAPVVVLRALVWYPLVYQQFPLQYLVGLLMISFMYGFYYYIQTGKNIWAVGVIANWAFALLMIWQMPYAVLTLRDSRWGTR